MTTAGSLIAIVSRPPSTSRVTSAAPSRDLDLGGEGRLRPAEQRRQHLAGLVGVVVDRLLAEDHELRRLLLDDLLQDLGNRQRLHLGTGLDQDRAVGADGERGAQRLLALGGPDRHHHDLGGHPASFRRTASSQAISSKGFIDILTLAVSTPVPSAFTRTLTL